jgi:sterol desaturase/sphingolipid hydroxylase (fatty acid hydroxylase superfamily)
MIDSLGTATIAMIWLAMIFVPLEWARPMWPTQRRLRRGMATDLAFFAGQHLLFGGLVVWVVASVIAVLPELSSLERLRAAFTSQPLALQAVEAIVLGDLAMYWGHRLQHRSAFLWRFHAVHHTAEHLDFMAAHREHPIDGLYTQVFMNLPALLLGFSLEGMMGLIAFRGLWATFIHANVRVPLGPLAVLFGSPQFHHIHHLRQRDVGNYANLAPWIDYLFGTHRGSAEAQRDIGLDTPAPRTYLGLLLYPFRRSPK